MKWEEVAKTKFPGFSKADFDMADFLFQWMAVNRKTVGAMRPLTESTHLLIVDGARQLRKFAMKKLIIKDA